MNFRVSKQKHFENKLFIQKLAFDFELLDVWEYPICFQATDDLYKFRKYAVEPTLKNAFNHSISGLLFLFRALIGKFLNLDKNVNKLPIPNCKEISLIERMTKVERLEHQPELDIDLQTDNFLNFRTVYSFKTETAHELSNETEHTIMHYALIKGIDGCNKVQMASYIKHRNKMGKFYITLISPFRHLIVYPYLFKEYVKRWNEYKLTTAQHMV